MRGGSTVTMAGKGWSVTVTDTDLTVTDTDAQSTRVISAEEAPHLQVRRQRLRWCICRGDQTLVRLRGITRADAKTLMAATRWLDMRPTLDSAVAWHTSVIQTLDKARLAQRWITTETLDELVASRPEPQLLQRVQAEGCEGWLSAEQREAASLLDTDLEAWVADVNDQITDVELTEWRAFFDTIEKTPLTEEQKRAVVCFDNRVQVLAAAGSGKTSMIVARAAYAVSRGFVAPERILLLAFNKDAARELQERVETRLRATGIDASVPHVSTFHAFGLDLIGRATGEKPRPASWLENEQAIDMVLDIVGELRDTSLTFRYHWDLFRLLFAKAPTTLEADDPDAYDSASRQSGYRTYRDEIVKSHGERLIADFLYLNGVNYHYERPYEVAVADAEHSQYRPDFYYPDIGVWHEHWALDGEGNPPESFHGYAQSMEWKRNLHVHHGTTLVETTWADVVFGDGLAKLKDDLTSLGLTFDWNADRPLRNKGTRAAEHRELARLVRTFMAHAKSNSWAPENAEHGQQPPTAGFRDGRTGLFLKVYEQIRTEWDRRLEAEGSVDFEDMIARAADHLEAGDIDARYDLVLVDELQDVSRARARLVRGVVAEPGRFLLAVGDDWQSINRFAGADLSVMTNFATWFGRRVRLDLTTTFRCPQTVCDVARTFVLRNPSQLDKPMRSARQDRGLPVEVVCAEDARGALVDHLENLSARVACGSVPASRDGTATVEVLGRYSHESTLMPANTPSNLRVSFRTVHKAKGLEADCVIVPGMTAETYGFPCTLTDDPLLELVMPSPDTYRHAEERRLFYVALTRARHAVALITSRQQMSPFVVELLDHADVTVSADGEVLVEACPKCGEGALVQRNGPYGAFLGCSTFPRCKHTQGLP